MLKCTLLGHPKPNVTWDRDGCKLDESDDRIHLRDDGSDYFLELADCSSSDSGKYTVSAKNSLGKQSATVDIIVSGTGGSTGKLFYFKLLPRRVRINATNAFLGCKYLFLASNLQPVIGIDI